MQFDYRDKDGYVPLGDPVPMPVTLKLRYAWQLEMASADVKLTGITAGTTEIIVATSDARIIQFRLEEYR